MEREKEKKKARKFQIPNHDMGIMRSAKPLALHVEHVQLLTLSLYHLSSALGGASEREIDSKYRAATQRNEASLVLG